MEREPSADKRDGQAGIAAGFSLAWQLGYMIAIPIVLLALGGKYLDDRFSTSPLFVLLGIVLAVVTTGIWVAFRLRAIVERLETKLGGPAKNSDTEKPSRP